MKCKQLALRVLSTAAILSIVSSIAAPVFAETYYIGNGHDLKIEAKDGKVYVNDHEDKDGEITIKGSAGEDSLSEKNEEKKEQETGENSGAEKQTVTEETPGEKTSAEEGETKKQDTPSENSDEEKDPANEKNENKKDDVPSAGENPQPEEKTIKKESASGSENALTALQSTAATRSAPEENTSAGNSPVSNVINVVNNWKDKILKITLDNVNIKVNKKDDKAAMSVSGSGDTEITLKGQNTLDASDASYRAGLEKAYTVDANGDETGNGGKLTITASDNEQSLTVTGGSRSAGIGGRAFSKASNATPGNSKAQVTGIEINGGKITAKGGVGGAGIGGGYGTSGEATINGGDITATGGIRSAGIGGGMQREGLVTINEGTVNATSGNDEGCGIGGGQWSRGGYVTINGGNVTAKSTQGGAGIGGSEATVAITNGTVNATGGVKLSRTAGGGAGIGGYGANVTITGGNITAIGTDGGAGIGQPGGKKSTGYKPGEIVISGNAQVTATGGAANDRFGAGAAIGDGGSDDSSGTPGEEVEVVTGNSTTATIVRNPAGTSADHTDHEWKFVSHADATAGHPGETVYHCACGADRTDYSPALPMPEPDNGTNAGTSSEAGYAPLTVLGADSFEQTTENDCLIITVPEESASLTGSLAALRELESSGIRTLVFRTRHCESSVRLADLTAQGSDEAVFVLSHSGENASLTLDGRDLTSLLA